MKEALRPPSGSPTIGGQEGLLGFLYSFLRKEREQDVKPKMPGPRRNAATSCLCFS